MSTMSPEQRKVRNKARREWIKRLDYYIECTKLPHDHEEYIHPSTLIEEVLDEIPEYDISEKTRGKYLKLLGVEE